MEHDRGSASEVEVPKVRALTIVVVKSKVDSKTGGEKANGEYQYRNKSDPHGYKSIVVVQGAAYPVVGFERNQLQKIK